MCGSRRSFYRREGVAGSQSLRAVRSFPPRSLSKTVICWHGVSPESLTRARSKRKRACPDPSEASKGTRTTQKLFFSPKAEFKETLAHPLHTSPKSALHTTPLACRRRRLKIQQRHFLSFISFSRAFFFFSLSLSLLVLFGVAKFFRRRDSGDFQIRSVGGGVLKCSM